MEKKLPSPYRFDRAMLKSLQDDECVSAPHLGSLRCTLTRFSSPRNRGGGSLPIQLSFSSSLPSDFSYGGDEDSVENQPVPTDHLSLLDDDCASFYSEEWDGRIDDEQKPIFRGAEETWGAFMMGYFSLSTCPDCNQHMVSVYDGAYVVCANCRLVYPLTPTSAEQYGIAMGFKPSWCHTLLQEAKAKLINGSSGKTNSVCG